MNSTQNLTGRPFLFVAFVSVIFITSSVGQTHSGAEGGRLIVYRASSFGSRLGLQVKIDGRTVASITQGHKYDGFIPAGHHELTVLAVPRSALRNKTSISLDVRPGHTYAFTAGVGIGSDLSPQIKTAERRSLTHELWGAVVTEQKYELDLEAVPN